MSYVSSNKVKTCWPANAKPKTKQSFAKECNINTIVNKYQKTGMLPCVDGGMYGDFSNVADFQIQRNRINAVTAFFKSLPAEVRAKFNHDPALMLGFAQNPANYEEAVKLCLIPKNPAIEKAKADKVAAENADLLAQTAAANAAATPQA